MKKKNHSVIVTIVKKGKAKKICQVAKDAGAKGGTTLLARGTSIKDFRKVFGISIDEQRAVVLTIVKQELEDKVFEEILDKCELNKPGTGITFIVDLKKVDGIAHLLKEASQND
ncbi:P-II family nitrogen regulator [Natranaerobius thermophilus]